jgi:hypothetical protein
MESSTDARWPRPLAEDEAAEIIRLRGLTLEQRGESIEAACRAAMEIECSRRDNGLPPSVPAPWPASTWALLSKHARHD